jgi:putative transposase
MSERITDDLTLNALGLALARRRPAPGVLHHSDRGSQYASGDYQQVLAQHGIICSMSRRANCWDNAVAESFFATLKVELVHDAAWGTRAAAAFGAGLPQSPGIRAAAHTRSTRNLTQVSTKPGQVQ